MNNCENKLPIKNKKIKIHVNIVKVNYSFIFTDHI